MHPLSEAGPLLGSLEEPRPLEGHHGVLAIPANLKCLASSFIEILPLELMEEIFLFCLPSTTYINPDPNHAPLLLCQVCRAWRIIAISSPRLWKSVSFQEYHSERMIGLWLSRAGNCPLAIAFRVPSYYELVFASKDWEIVGRSSQWRNVAIMLESKASFRNLAAAISSLPLIHTLKLNMHTFSGTKVEGQEEFFGLLHSASNLRKISWYLTTINPCTVNLPWGSLTEFDSSFELSTSETVQILLDAPRLRRLMLVGPTRTQMSSGIVTLLPPTIVHRHLNDLKLFTRSGTLGDLFDAISLPALESLRLGCVGFRSWQHEQFFPFLSRSCSKLRSFDVDYHGFTEENIIQYLRCTPRLTYIRLMGDFVTDHLISLLTYHGDVEEPCLCPMLKSIILSGPYNDKSVMKLICSRWRLEPPFDPGRWIPGESMSKTEVINDTVSSSCTMYNSHGALCQNGNRGPN